MAITFKDLEGAVFRISAHGDDYKALGYRASDYRTAVQQIVELTQDANRSVNRVMGFGATLAWGIAIGILAERSRYLREGF